MRRRRRKRRRRRRRRFTTDQRRIKYFYKTSTNCWRCEEIQTTRHPEERADFHWREKDPKAISFNDAFLPKTKLHHDIARVVSRLRNGNVPPQADLKRMLYQIIQKSGYSSKYKFQWPFDLKPKPMTNFGYKHGGKNGRLLPQTQLHIALNKSQKVKQK